VLDNTAGAMNYAGLHVEAILCCERAIEISRSQTDRASYENANVALCNMALGYFYLEQHQTALEAIRECLARSAEPEEGRATLSRVTREWIFVQLALELGLVDEALRHAAICERYAKWGGSVRCTGMAAIARGLCKVHAGDVEDGLHALASVLTTASDSRLYRGSLREDARRALTKAYEVVGRPQDALEHLTALIDDIRAPREATLTAALGWRRGGGLTTSSTRDRLNSTRQSCRRGSPSLRLRIHGSKCSSAWRLPQT
jgi:tetratricopeptide (TPR) repeat protein